MVMPKKGDHIKVRMDFSVYSHFFDVSMSDLRMLQTGDIVTVIKAFQDFDHGICVVYECKGNYLDARHTGEQIINADLIYSNSVNFEIVDKTVETSKCTCSRTTLLISGCTCGHLKRYGDRVLQNPS